MWLKLDNSVFDGVEDAKRLLSTRIKKSVNGHIKIDRRDAVNVEASTKDAYYIDKIRPGQVVFVTDKMYKRFGTLVGSNGQGTALIRFPNIRGVVAIDPHLAIIV